MQIHYQTQQKPKSQQQQLNQQQNKKISILKRKKVIFHKIHLNPHPKYIVNIGDVCFIDQDSLRSPQQSEETLLKALFHYKMISKVTLNNSFVKVDIKKNQDNVLPPEYFIERLRSFGDQQMANIANHLERIHKHFLTIRQSPPQMFNHDRENQKIIMNNFLKQMQGKKYFVYFSSIFPEKILLKSIVFSVPLLKALGCNIKNLALDFLRYKHIFFEVFTAKNYANFMEKCMQTFAELNKKLVQNPNFSQQQKSFIAEFFMQEQVIKRRQSPQGIYQQIHRAKLRWFSPHPSICCFQILQIDQNNGISTKKMRKIDNFIQTHPQQQLNSLRRIGFNSPQLVIQKNNINSQSNLQKQSPQKSINNVRQHQHKNHNDDNNDNVLYQKK